MRPPSVFSSTVPLLKTLAALVWFSGAAVLMIKATLLVLEAQQLYSGYEWSGGVVAAGVLIGVLKAKYLFTPICRKNLRRIAALEQPLIWQFYRLRFFAFLITMVVLGAWMSRLAHGHYAMLYLLALVEISVGTALLGSSHCFRDRASV